MKPLRALTFLILAITLMPPIAHADPRAGEWKKQELTEQFMRSLTKSQCMTKTIATLNADCSSNECLRNLAGITGDCVTWAAGDMTWFCLGYDREYIGSYCRTNELDANRCSLLHIARPRLCSGSSSTR
jgi:hypothetical protein